MLLSTRDAQRERRHSLDLASAANSDRLNVSGIDNASFRAESTLDVHRSNSPQLSVSIGPIEDEQQDDPSANSRQQKIPSNLWEQIKARKKKYQWRMTHFFYLHMFIFIINGFLGGLIIYLIENYSASRNREFDVPYIDAWFLSCTCVFSCGLTTVDFAKISGASQGVMMFLTFISGITISTLPALVIKAYTHKNVSGLQVDDDHGKPEEEEEDGDELPTFNAQRQRNLPARIRDQLKTLPTPTQIRYRAYITCIITIFSTCIALYTIVFVAIGCWLTRQYTPDQLMQDNSTVNPWYISFVVVLTGFNQNGLIPFSDGFVRFVDDVFLNIFTMIVSKNSVSDFCWQRLEFFLPFEIVMSGTSLFPFILRNVIVLMRRIVPWRHKVIFDYILTNNHRLSTQLFPTVQTRIYLLVTTVLYIMGVGISLILDLNRETFAMYPVGTRVLIFFFQTISSRFAGFSSVDMNSFATATLLVYLVLMGTKPQMLCAIDQSPFELSWLALQAKEEVVAQTGVSKPSRRMSIASMHNRAASVTSVPTGTASPMRPMEHFLRRQSLVTKDLARKEFAQTTVINGIQTKQKHLRILRVRLFLIYFCRALIKHTFSFVLLTRTWLFFFIFLICAIEYRRMAPVDPEITVFKVIFEIISAFGAVGLTLGYPNIASSFCTVLSSASKTIVIITMFMGRHRGLLASMKDQEVIEFSASDLLNLRREELMNHYEKSKLDDITNNADEFAYRIDRF